MNNFLPSAVKFHYQFNLREMSNIVGGLCRMTKDMYRDPTRVRPGRTAGLSWCPAPQRRALSLGPLLRCAA